MAPRRTPEQKAEVGSFVNRLYEMSQAPSWQEFARKAGVWSPNLSKWQTGQAVPEGWNLFSLVKEAARVRANRPEESPATTDEQAATAVAAGSPEAQSPHDPLAKLREEVAETQELVYRGFAALGVQLRPQVQEQPPADAQEGTAG